MSYLNPLKSYLLITQWEYVGGEFMKAKFDLKE